MISFLARDTQAVSTLLHHMVNKERVADAQNCALPVPSGAAVTKSMLQVPYRPVVKTWEAGMVKILNPDYHYITSHCTEVRDGQRETGNVV
jgi:hypothetical protein